MGWWISPEVLARLDADPASRVVLVVAPGGSGKSRLIDRWLGSHPDRAWRWADAARDDRGTIAQLTQEAALETRDDDYSVLVVANAEYLEPDAVADLVETVPPGVRLVLISAGEVLPAAVEVELAGQIDRLTPADLWWPLDVVGDAELMRITGGWPAGVLLKGDRQAVLEFVADEIPLRLREFVLTTAPLDFLRPEVCAALVPGVNPHTVLIDLRRFGLLDDGQPFAVHPRYRDLVRAAALHRLRQEDPEAEARILRQAGEAARGRGDEFSAFRWFTAAGAWDAAFDVLGESLAEGLRGWSFTDLRDLLRSVPPSAWADDAGRGALMARAKVLAGLARPGTDLAPGQPGAQALLEARAAQFTDPRAVRRHLLEAGPGDAPPYIVVGGLGADAWVAARAGELNHAQRTAARARSVAENAGLHDHPFLAGVVLAWAELLRARGRTDEALDELRRHWALLTEHEQLGDLTGRPVRSAAQLLRAALTGEYEEPDDNLPPVLEAERNVVRARLALRENDVRRAEGLLERTRSAEAAALRVEAALRRSAPEVAQRVIETWPAENTLANGLRRLLSRAALALALDRRSEAGDCVQAAVAAAESDGHVQVFLDAAGSLWPIELAVLRRPGTTNPWRRELSRRLDEARAGAEPAEAPVTRRERVVLEHLARPLTHAQIASALFVSENTLKSHCRNLYRKLGVSSRADALSVARTRGWLPPEPQGDVVLNLDVPTAAADAEL
jgi:LuxR family transcriptional regulator, maltose regulon positive regulatory protein